MPGVIIGPLSGLSVVPLRVMVRSGWEWDLTLYERFEEWERW